VESEKADALESKGLNTDFSERFTMNKYKSDQHEYQLPPVSRAQNTNLNSWLEKTKLSRRPEFKRSTLNNIPTELTAVVNACVGCNGLLDAQDTTQLSVKVCRKCLIRYAVIDAAIEAESKRKRQAMLEKFATEVK
jgi:hypothetical protein